MAQRRTHGNVRALIEAVVGGVIGLMLLVSDQGVLAGGAVILGLLLSVSRWAAETRISELEERLDRLAHLAGIRIECDTAALDGLIEAYAAVDPEFVDKRDVVARQAQEALAQLGAEATLDNLDLGEYYALLFRGFSGATREVVAVSLGLDAEWSKTAAERRFLECNQGAALRGVRVDRLFVVTPEELDELRQSDAIRAHLASEPPEQLRGWYVDKRLLEARDPHLLEDLGSGFVVIDAHAAYLDRSQAGALAGGSVTTRRIAIARLVALFDRVHAFAQPFEDLAVPLDRPRRRGRRKTPN